MYVLPRPLLFAILLSLGLHAFLLTRDGWLPAVTMPEFGDTVLEMVMPAVETPVVEEVRHADVQQPVKAALPEQLTPPFEPAVKAAALPLVPADTAERLAASEALPERQQTVDSALAANPAATELPQAEVAKTEVLASAPTAATLLTDEPPADAAEAQLLLASHLPQQAQIDYALFAYGTRLGTGRMLWQQTAGKYRLSVELSPLIGPGLQYESSGKVLARGLQPESFTATRNGKAREWARFDWQAKLLRYGEGEEKTVALQGGAVDWLSLSFDLAARGLGNKPLAKQITTGKKVYAFNVLPKGQDEFDPKHEEGQAQIVQARKDKEMIEIWLAPAFANLPVRISKQDEDRTLSLRASRIEINGTVAWRLP